MEQSTKYVFKHEGYMSPLELEGYIAKARDKSQMSFDNPVVKYLDLRGKSSPDELTSVLIICVEEETDE